MDSKISFNSSVTFNDTSNGTIDLPIFVSYLILIFRIFSTVYVTVIGIAVIRIVTKKNGDVTGPQVLFIVNLMVSGIVSAVNATLQSSIMIVSYIAGVKDPMRCDILFITLSTFHVNAFAFFLLAIDKVIAVMIPNRYGLGFSKQFAGMVIFASWVLSFFISIVRLHKRETYTKSSQYGVCIPHHDSFVSLLVNFVAPIFLSFVFALGIDIYMCISVYKMKKKLQYEENQSRNTENHHALNKLRQKLSRIAASSISPLVAVLVSLVSHSLLGVLSPILFITTQVVDTNVTYKFLAEHIVIPNAAYCFLVSYSIVYNVYFRKIRQPTFIVIKSMAIMMYSCVIRCVWCRCIEKRSVQIAPMSRSEEENTSRSEEENISRSEEVEGTSTSTMPEPEEDISRPEEVEGTSGSTMLEAEDTV